MDADKAEQDPYGPVGFSSGRTKRQDSAGFQAVLFDVPLESEDPPEPEDREDYSCPRRGPGLRRTMRWTRAACIVGTAFLVAVLLLVLPIRSGHSPSPETASSGADPPASSSGPDTHASTPGAIIDDSPPSGQTQASLTDVATHDMEPPPQTCSERGFTCVGDRLSREEELETGDAICSTNDRFMFGVDENGALIWQDCSTGDSRQYYEGGKGYSFKLSLHGAFVVLDQFDEVEKQWKCKEVVESSTECFHEFDCPFLHIHKVKGKVVLNWEDRQGWHMAGIGKLYEF